MHLDTPLKNDRLTLKPLTPDAANGPYAEWMRDAELLTYTEARFGRHDTSSLRTFIDRCNLSEDTLLLGIFSGLPERHIGNIKIGPINRYHGTGDIGIIVGDRTAWGQGFASGAISLLAEYALSELGLQKITAGCYSTNPGAIKAFQKAGFSVEGQRRSQYLDASGVRVDGILLGRLRHH